MILCSSTLTLLLLWAAGVSPSVLITQWPEDIVLPPDGSAEMHCYQNNTDYEYLYWYRKLKGKSFQLMFTIAVGSATPEEDFKSGFSAKRQSDKKQWSLTIPSVQSQHEAVYLCAASAVNAEAYFGPGTKLTVLEDDNEITPPTVKIFPPSKKECGDHTEGKRTIVCVATGFYPDHVKVSWKLNNTLITDGVATDSAPQREDKTYRINSRVRVSKEDWHDSDNNFTCIVNFFDGKKSVDKENFIMGEKAKTGKMTREDYLKITQTAKLSYTVFIVKSCLYGAFVAFLVFKLQGRKQKI